MGLAKAVGLSHVAISYYLRGKRSPRLATARRLEKVTGVPVAIWRGGDINAIRDALSGVNIFTARNKTSNKGR